MALRRVPTTEPYPAYRDVDAPRFFLLIGYNPVTDWAAYRLLDEESGLSAVMEGPGLIPDEQLEDRVYSPLKARLEQEAGGTT